MEVAVMGEVIVIEVIVIVAMPIVAMPRTMATIPGNVTTATMPACSPEVPTSDVASMPTAATEVGAAHMAASKAGAAHVATTKVGAARLLSLSKERRPKPTQLLFRRCRSLKGRWASALLGSLPVGQKTGDNFMLV